MSVQETQPHLADASSREKSAAERKAEAIALRPVRNHPQAATSTKDFVKLVVNEMDADGNLVQVEAQPVEPLAGSPEARIAAKNAKSDATRAALRAAKAEGDLAKTNELLEEVRNNATAKLNAKDEEIAALKAQLAAKKYDDGAPAVVKTASDAVDKAKAMASAKKGA